MQLSRAINLGICIGYCIGVKGKSIMGLFGKKKSATTNGSESDAGKNDDDIQLLEPMKWKEDPEMSANFFSRLTFLWVQPMFSR